MNEEIDRKKREKIYITNKEIGERERTRIRKETEKRMKASIERKRRKKRWRRGRVSIE